MSWCRWDRAEVDGSGIPREALPAVVDDGVPHVGTLVATSNGDEGQPSVQYVDHLFTSSAVWDLPSAKGSG
jgi:hypothetical protein